jgi:hypothetical protein
MAEQTSNWTVNFIFDGMWSEIELKNSILDVNFHTERVKDGIKLNGFEILIRNTTQHNARLIAEGKASVIFNYLSRIHHFPVKGHLTNMIKDRGEGTATVEASMGLVSSEIIDLAEINSAINGKDERYLRQLSHYARGLEAADIVTKYREFYQVYEDEITKNQPTRSPAAIKNLDEDVILRVIRHLLNHPRVTGPEAVAIANKILGKTSIDLDSTEDLSLVEAYLKKIQRKAEEILHL